MWFHQLTTRQSMDRSARACSNPPCFLRSMRFPPSTQHPIDGCPTDRQPSLPRATRHVSQLYGNLGAVCD